MTQFPLVLPEPQRRFDGHTYSPEHDCERLTGQLLAVWEAMQDGDWHTLEGIARAAKCSEASASARLRDLRKPRWGSHTVERRRCEATGCSGLFFYRLVQQERAAA
jgi:hypothetical protein